jgi:hypothetical protein
VSVQLDLPYPEVVLPPVLVAKSCAAMHVEADATCGRILPVVPPERVFVLLACGAEFGSSVVCVLRVEQAYWHQPQLVVKQVLPAVFSLALEARGEGKPAAAQLLGTLAHVMGPAAVICQASHVSSAVEGKVRDLLAGSSRGAAGYLQ